MASKKIKAKDLFAQKEMVLEVSEIKVKGFTDGFNAINAASFPSNVITMIRANSYTKNSSQIFYFDEHSKSEQQIVVPNDFLFTPADKDTTKKLMDTFKAWMVANLAATCRYMGQYIGSDPEVFIENGKGELIPAFDFLGSKEKPTTVYDAVGYNPHANRDGQKIPQISDNNPVYWDGFQAEFTTSHNSCMQVHGDSIRSGLVGALYAARKKFPDAKLSTRTVFDVPMNLLKTSKPEYVAFGCRASLNAYGLEGKKANGEEVTYRSAGGHIHFGFGDDLARDKKGIVKMVKALDAVLGVACVSMFAKFDDPRRRQMYGLAGEYRLPKYGFEYRTLSNAWMFHPMIAHMVFDLARSVTTFGYKDLLEHWQCEEKETIRIINECDVTAARKVIRKNKNILLKLINVRYQNMDQAEFVFDVIMHGMESVVKNPKDFESNWQLRLTDNWSSFQNKYVRSAMNAKAKV